MDLQSSYLSTVDKKKQKKLGQYFTPDTIAHFMSKWAANKAETILDPAFGNGIFYQKINENNIQYTGYEIDQEILDYFNWNKNNRDNLKIINEDFLLSNWEDKYDAIICNPPYNRFQAISNRHEILNIFEEQTGIKLTAYTNQSILFLIKAIYQLKESGCLAFIVPNEFLNSKYGNEIKQILLREKILKGIIHFKDSVFSDVVTTNCIILVENKRNEYVEFIELEDVDSLKNLSLEEDVLSQHSKKIAHETLKNKDKWLNILIEKKPPVKTENLVQLSSFAKVTRGIATGANAFFVFDKKKVKETKIEKEFFDLCITRSADIKKPVLTEEYISQLIEKNKKVFLLNIEKTPSKNLENYLDDGIEEGINKKYLPKKRRPWYSMEKRRPGQIFISTASRNGLKVIRNVNQYSTLTTFHSIHMKKEDEKFTNILYAYLLTPTAQKILKLNSKEMGGGLTKFQPNDYNEAFILNFSLITAEDLSLIEKLYSEIIEKNELLFIDELDSIFSKYLS